MALETKPAVYLADQFNLRVGEFQAKRLIYGVRSHYQDDKKIASISFFVTMLYTGFIWVHIFGFF